MAKDDMKILQKVRKSEKNPDGVMKRTLESFDKRPISRYYEIAGDLINVENHIYEATALYDAGSVINQAHIATLFEKGSKQKFVVPNSKRGIEPQGEILTNMVTDGEFDNGNGFLLSQIAVDIFLSADRATVTQDGAIINPVVAASTTFSAANHLHAMRNQFKLEFIRSEDQKQVEGKIYQFPSPFAASGAIGASVGGFVQNSGLTGWNKLSEIHALRTNDRFRVEITPLVDGFTPQVDLVFKVLFIGKRITKFIA